MQKTPAAARICDLYYKESISLKWMAGKMEQLRGSLHVDTGPTRRDIGRFAASLRNQVDTLCAEAEFGEIKRYRDKIGAHTDPSQAGPYKMKSSFPTRSLASLFRR